MAKIDSEQHSRFAVVDIGSNSVKLTVYRCSDEGEPVALLHDADTVRVGFQVAESGRIAKEREERLIATLKRFEQDARSRGAMAFHGVATQAFRMARNGPDVVCNIQDNTSWSVRIIDAREETTLTVAGAAPWLIPGAWNVVADIGGASTEIASVEPDVTVTAATSVPIGSGVLFDTLIGSSPPPEGSMERASEAAAAAIDASGVMPKSATAVLLPGGTGQFLDMLSRSLADGRSLAPDTIPNLHQWLSSRHAIETMERIPIQFDRAEILPASLAVVEALVSRVQPAHLLAIPSGIRDGLARDICRFP